MKILAIRLKNLASLAGEHAIDFTQEPLASAGLFAITGPTGAGKSTLLDALCLALFGSTPRLTGVSLNNKVPDGDDELGGGDERNLLRRGCANGYAEVDFVGLDGDHYRARWEVRRARDRAQGRLQSSQQSLHNITTQQVLASGKKREFHDALEAKLGLSFAQFTRAVLLAQSEFSAFLKADDNERGSLLEKLTDTALYSRLGQAAYEKRKQAQAERDQLERQLGDLKPLDNDARAALEQQLKDLETHLKALNENREQWLEQAKWLDSADALQAQLSQAQTAKTDAKSAWDNLANARELIEQFDACADVREPYIRRQRLLEQQQRLSEQQPAIEARAQQSKAAVEQAQAQLTAANDIYSAAQTQQKNAEPAIAEARVALQAKLAAEQQHAQTQRALAAAESELSQAQTQLNSTEQKHAKLSERQQQLQQALEPSAALESLIDGWPLLSENWQNLLNQRAQQRRLIAAQSQLRAALQHAIDSAVQAEQPIVELKETYQQQPLNQQLQTLGDQLIALDQQLTQLNQQQDVWQRHQDAERQCAELEQDFKTTAAQCEQIVADGKQARAAHEQASAELKSLQKLLETQRLARLPSVEELRQHLQPDSPCPVCGSLEHPLHSSAAQEALNRQAAADDKLLAEADAKVQSANERLLTLRDQHITLNGQQKLRHEQLEREQRNRDALLERLTQLALPDTFWQQTHSAQQHWFSAQHTELSQQRTLLAEQIKHCRADQARLEQLSHAFAAAQEAQRTQQQAVDKNASDCEHVQQTLDNLNASLFARLPADYHALLVSDEPSTYQQLDARIQQRMAQQQQLRALEPELAECSTILRQQQNALPAAQAKQQNARTDAASAQQTSEAATKALQACLGEHHSIEQWQQQLSTQLEAALSRLSQCRDYEAQQQLQLQAAEHAAANLKARLDEAAEEHKLVDHQVKTWLTEHLDWQPEQLAHLMALSSEHVQQQRQQLDNAKDALSRAEERYLSVEQQWQTHQQRYPQAPTREKVAAQLEQLKTQFDAQQSEAERLRSECLLDDQRREQATQWLAKLDDAQATYLRWAKLADLIGSADGAAFRRIAQGYNLDLLVQHANVQLRQLAKRYRLQRGGSPLGLLVLDTDMGDELRSVHSLSGGETFLVSLALALGLASMASSKMPINSLFIDEGFGSLDPESLQVAMDALDNLQAQGRKVAVISHVAEMHERIPVKVQVQRQGNGQSSVQIVAG